MGGNEKFKQIYHALFSLNGLFVSSCDKLTFTNIQESSIPSSYENSAEIKEYAPFKFRMGNRLVTISDYTQYIKNTFKNIINDIYVCNNATYTTVFYQWLLKYDKLNIDIRKNNYKYSDACDFNNIYLWMVPTHERKYV